MVTGAAETDRDVQSQYLFCAPQMEQSPDVELGPSQTV